MPPVPYFDSRVGIRSSLTMMRTFSIGFFCLTLLGACSAEPGSPRPPPMRYPAEDALYPSARDRLERDLGRGVLFLADSPGEGTRSDTLAIHRAPDRASEVEALFVYDQPDPNSWSYSVWSDEPALVSDVLEFRYEESGLPLDSIDSSGWARVLYARDQGGAQRTGWVELRQGHVSYVLWKDFLPGRGLYLLPPGEPMFHAAPRGQPLAISLGDDYELIPLEVDGDWMQVLIRTPSTCSGATDEILERSAWIPYLTPDGRPRVWYYSRGC